MEVSTPRIMLATLCLNEMEWLPRSWDQHGDWPGVVGWAFVEGADRAYAGASPHLTTKAGLSVDGTTAWLRDHSWSRRGPNAAHFQLGFFGDGGPEGKCGARNKYLELADAMKPDWIVVLDADEFYTKEDQARITRLLAQAGDEPRTPILLRQRYPWRPDSIRYRALSDEVVGGYWDVPHLRIFPFYQGMRHTRSHNHPELEDGGSLRNRMAKLDVVSGTPQCVHMAFASGLQGRQAKHRYYVQRGEGTADGRQSYVECRAAWEAWKPGDVLPQGARVIPYAGPMPECFL